MKERTGATHSLTTSASAPFLVMIDHIKAMQCSCGGGNNGEEVGARNAGTKRISRTSFLSVTRAKRTDIFRTYTQIPSER